MGTIMASGAIGATRHIFAKDLQPHRFLRNKHLHRKMAVNRI